MKVKSQQNIRLLIGLMSLALIGVILIQFLWIRNAMKLKQEQFDHSVNMAMIRVSAQLENKYGVHFITEKLEKDSSAKNEMLKKDPGFYKFMISMDDDGQLAEEEKYLWRSKSSFIDVADETDAEEVSVSKTGGASIRHRVIAMVNVNGNQKQEVVIKKSMVHSDACTPLPPTPPVPDEMVKTNLIKIVNNVANEYEMSKMNVKDISDVIDSQKICKAIEKEFRKQGLPLNFDFATYCVDGDTLMINRGASSDPLKDYEYKSPLLATDFIEAGSLLLIRFPAHLTYLFASMAGMLTLSLFFTLALISAFAYSLHVIFQQKKLSDITNDFINNMTHELKTPLATISMTADTIGLAAASNQHGRMGDYSGMIKNEVKKLSHHVDRILEAAVLETTSDENTEKLDVNEVLSEEVKTFEPQVQKKGGRIELHLQPVALRVCANRDLLCGVIDNLVDNAIKYSDEAPLIHIYTHDLGDRVMICVADSGIGIRKADQKMIFEKFYRAHTGNRHNVKGFGLGLSFVKNVVENLGGKVWTDSEPGKGSKFFIQLPKT